MRPTNFIINAASIAGCLSILTAMVACEAPLQGEDDVYGHEVSDPFSTTYIATITFSTLVPASALIDFLGDYEATPMVTYAYARHDDAQIGTLATKARPQELEDTLRLVSAVEGVEFLGVGAFVIQASDETLTRMRHDVRVNSLDQILVDGSHSNPSPVPPRTGALFHNYLRE